MTKLYTHGHAWLRTLKFSGWALVLGLAVSQSAAYAGSFNIFGLDSVYTLSAGYAYAIRLEEPSNGVIDTPGRSEVPIPESLKFPESNNFDDGDRNFKQYDAVNNRITLLGDLQINFNDDWGVLVRGDAFYDQAYHSGNANDAPDRLNTRQQPGDTFTDSAKFFSGSRARVLDAYIFGSFNLDDFATVNVKLGKHIAAWGQSLFFSGVALAQSPADATKATVPGADVKSILLPVNQFSTRISFGSGFTLLGQVKFQYKATELNPTGDFFSVSDIIGPGAEFAYGIRNPLFLDTLSNIDITDPSQLAGVADLLDQIFLNSAPNQGALNGLLGPILNGPIGDILQPLPSVSLPQLGNLLNAPTGLNPQRLDDIRPDKWDFGQWGVGLEYALDYTTTVGYYHLNYHNTTPAPVQNFGSAVLIPAQNGIPAVTTESLGLNVPITYNIKYFEDVKLDAVSFSSILFGANVGGELIYRDGIDVLVDVDSGIGGLVPTPTRAKSYQALLNAINVFGPGLLWDSLTLVGEIGYIYVDDVDGQPSQEGPREGQKFNNLTFDKDAAAFAALAIFSNRNVFPGWDMQVPISVQGQVYNRPAVAGAFGSLLGQGDYRLGVGIEFTRLQKLTLGLRYNGFLGKPEFLDHPLQDRDTLAVTAKYQF